MTRINTLLKFQQKQRKKIEGKKEKRERKINKASEI